MSQNQTRGVNTVVGSTGHFQAHSSTFHATSRILTRSQGGSWGSPSTRTTPCYTTQQVGLSPPAINSAFSLGQPSCSLPGGPGSPSCTQRGPPESLSVFQPLAWALSSRWPQAHAGPGLEGEKERRPPTAAGTGGGVAGATLRERGPQMRALESTSGFLYQQLQKRRTCCFAKQPRPKPSE